MFVALTEGDEDKAISFVDADVDLRVSWEGDCRGAHEFRRLIALDYDHAEVTEITVGIFEREGR